MKLEQCINATTCLPRTPIVARVKRGACTNIFVDTGAYRTFLRTKFNVAPIDMESAAVVLICYQKKFHLLHVIRALPDLAGGGSEVSNEASNFSPLAAQNAVSALVKFVTLLWETVYTFNNYNQITRTIIKLTESK